MHPNLKKIVKISAADTPNIDGAGAVSEFVHPVPMLVTKVGIIATTAVDTDNSVALTATLSRRPVLGSSSNAVTLGVFTMAPANNTAELPAGAVKYKELAILDHDGETAEDGSLRNEAPNSNLVGPITGLEAYLILPGQSFAMTLDSSAEADSGAVISWIEAIELPFVAPYLGTNVKRDVTND
jgi:hypothetical protein